MFSAELPWCLVFVQKINFREKSPKICQSPYFYRRTTDPEGEMGEPRGAHTTWWRGPGLAAPPHGVSASVTSLCPPFAYILPLYQKHRGFVIFQKGFHCSIAIPNPRSGTRNPFWHSAGIGIWRISSPSSSPMPLHQPSMMPPSMCE